MAASEMWVPQALALIFIALPLIRPFFKRSRSSRSFINIDGLRWLPLIALLIMIGIFPAYGFRFECLPMLVFALIMSLINLLSSRYGGSIYDRRPFFSALALIVLTACAVPMFVFPPRALPQTAETADSEAQARTLEISGLNREYTLRIYEAAQGANRPVIFLIPPEIGGAASVELVCAELNRNNYTVVTYARKGFDNPFAQLRYWRIHRSAASRASANERGKALEADRRLDIEILLSRLPSALGDGYGRQPPVLLAGYGAGGSALAYMAREGIFASRYRSIIGAIAIESRLWSAYQSEERQAPPVAYNAGFARRHWTAFTGWLSGLRPLRVVRTGPLPGESSAGGIPVLYLVSGRALDERGRLHYQAVFDSLRQGSGPAALAAIESAGLFDYQDIPFTHPALSFLNPGLKGAEKSANPVSDTAAIISNFASYLQGVSARQPISSRVHVESRGLPGFRL